MTADLVVHLAQLGSALRGRGVDVSVRDEADGLRSLTLIDLADRDEVRRALRTTLKIRRDDVATFEEIFARDWGARVARQVVTSVAPRPAPPRAAPPLRGSLPVGGPLAETAAATAEGEEPGWSPAAALRHKSFDTCSPADLRAMERLMARLVAGMANRPSRRRVPARGRGDVDLRRSFHRTVASGGELVTFARRTRAIEELRPVVLCDTSGSMDPHARFVLAFFLALGRTVPRSELFAFNTALVRLTPWLRAARGNRLETALERLAARVPDWSGGTRIGECLAEFVRRYGRELVDHRTVVLILSDGLDRGEIDPLAQALETLRSRARRILWLNPLAGDRRYEPTARAMAAALPYLDRLLPAHNLAALERLVPLLRA